MVSKTPKIRPMRFSALKALDPLQDEEEHGEHHDGQADIDHVGHGALLAAYIRTELVNLAEPG
jgi:hypothetical protein